MQRFRLAWLLALVCGVSRAESQGHEEKSKGHEAPPAAASATDRKTTDHADHKEAAPQPAYSPAPQASPSAVADKIGDHAKPSTPPKAAKARRVRKSASPKGSHAAHHGSSESSASVTDSGSGVPALQALALLKEGNARYVNNLTRLGGRGPEDRKRLVGSQKPHTVVVSCSDSRVPPETVFDQGLGDLFTIRVAGEALDYSVLASVEYALEHLGARLVVVMGHTSCGAVKAALSLKEGESTGSASLDNLILDIQPRLKGTSRSVASIDLEEPVTANAKGVAKDLFDRSNIVKKHVKSGKLKILSAVYHLDTGLVDFH